MPPRRERGFTLIEVLVALVVTSLILAIVMNASLEAKARAVAAADKQDASLLAQSLIAGRLIAPFDATPRGGEAGGLRWSVTESRAAGDAQAPFLLAEIAVTVRDGKNVALAGLKARRIKPVPRP
jgi:prepilin-type N-terminal cleavage/methylation domain-containing protein